MVLGKGVIAGGHEKTLIATETDKADGIEPLNQGKGDQNGRIKCHSEEGKHQKMEADACGER
jgi:hypothetical protein